MASTYSFVDYDSDEDPQPAPANLFAAATYTASLFESHGVSCAFMGGFCMMLRGSTRTTSDVDVAVDTTMKSLWEIISSEPRLRIPDKRTIEGVIRVFVRTGPSVGDEACATDVDVGVDLKVAGSKAPLSVTSARVEIPFSQKGQTGHFYGLSLYEMMRTKLRAFTDRFSTTDFEDLVFMVVRFPDEVKGFREQLDQDEIRIVLESDDFYQLGKEDRQMCLDILGIADQS